MSEIAWTDALDIDLPLVNEQHKELIALSNSLIQAMINGMGKDVLAELFRELRDYTSYHFDAEEKYMEKISYPELDHQKAAHRKLKDEVDEFSTRLLGGQGVSPTEALDFINDWIIRHILEMDSRIGVYAKGL
ncbi:MAG: hemerythrin family protein [Pseudodesulfovibrio sp.]|nr:hemerythrin family protein [Pseudodesulfovibrio sp.]